MTPFLSLPRQLFAGEIHVIASKVSYVEIVLSRVSYHLVIGLDSGNTIESPAYEPVEKSVTVLRDYRDSILDDLAEKLGTPDAKPEYAALPTAGGQ